MFIHAIRLTCALALCCTGAVCAGEEAAEAPESAPRFEETFADGHERWEFTDPACWALEEEDGVPFLSLQRNTDTYEPEVRSPRNIAWLKEPKFGSFTLDVQARYTGRDYGHADLCFFFGKQDATHFYYVHIAHSADPHANAIFLVNGAPRVSIATETNDGNRWTDGWHHVRIVRDVESGVIEVYRDDMETPIMKAVDTTHGDGQIGVGSFDDRGQFTILRVR